MTSKRATTPKLEYATSREDWNPHAYQLRAVKHLLENGGAALFLDPGLGKTSITLAAKKVLLKRQMTGKTLVIAPLRVCHAVWPREVEKWKDFEGLSVEVLHGKNREERLWNTKADILCINPEGLEWLFGVEKVTSISGKKAMKLDAKRVRRLMNELEITDLVVDESTKFKNTASQRFKILKETLPMYQRRWILTGTPAPNSMLDLFGQMYIVDLGHALGRYITHYRASYFESFGFGGFNYRLRPGAEKTIYAKLKKSTLRLAAEDYLQLPELIDNVIKFDLPESAREIYDSLEDEFVAEMDSGLVTALNAGSALTKCAQVANGGLYNQKDPLIAGGRKKSDGWSLIHHAKDEIVADLVEELNGQPVLIAYEFQHDLERLLEVFGKDTPVLGGSNMNKMKQIEADWNRGKIPVLLAHPASAGHGLNLQGASAAPVGHVIWYGISYDYELYDQFIKRVLRQGSKHLRVIAHHIIARDTVDEAKLYALRRKRKGQNNLLDALRVYVAARKPAQPLGLPGRAAKALPAVRPGPNSRHSKTPAGRAKRRA